MAPTIEQRIETLERQNRRLKLLSGSTIGLVLLVALFGQATSKKAGPPALRHQVIEAELFVLRDKLGRIRAQLGVDGEVAKLSLYDENEDSRIDLVASKRYSVLTLSGSSGKPCVAMSVSKDVTSLNFVDWNGKIHMDLRVYKDGTPALTFWDSEGTRCVAMSASKDGTSLSLLGGNGKTGAGLFVSRAGSGLTLADSNGTRRTELGVDKNGPSLTLFDDRLERRAVLGLCSQETIRTGTVTQRPESSLVLYDKDGKIIWQAPKD